MTYSNHVLYLTFLFQNYSLPSTSLKFCLTQQKKTPDTNVIESFERKIHEKKNKKKSKKMKNVRTYNFFIKNNISYFNNS